MPARASAQASDDLARRYDFDGGVNNVDLARLREAGEIRLNDADDILRVNLHPTIHTMQALLPGMRER